MIALRRRKIRRKRNKLVVLRRTVFIALATIIGILVTNIILSSVRNANQSSVMPATAASQDKVVQQESTSVQLGIGQQLEASQKAIAQLVDFAVPERFQGTIVHDIQSNNPDKVIALTFDDGPWRKTTAQVLEILKKNNIKATFFWVGKHLQNYPEGARQVVADGHAIGNHTWSHQYHRFDGGAAAREIEDTSALIYKTTGVKTALFRPPGGALKNGLAGYAQKNKYAVMMWSVDSGDSRNHRIEAPTLVSNVLKSAKPGGIVLMHDGGGNHSTTVQALPQIIDGLRKEGYKFVTVPELLQMQDKASKAQTHSNSFIDAGQQPPSTQQHKDLTE